MRFKNQKEQVLDYIKAYGSITMFDGYKDLGITKTDTVVSNLRKDGHNIKGERKYYTTKLGQKKHYMVYTMGEQNG